MIIINYALCDECATCVSVCGNNALMLVDRLEITRESCIECCACVTVCPFGALSQGTDTQHG